MCERASEQPHAHTRTRPRFSLFTTKDRQLFSQGLFSQGPLGVRGGFTSAPRDGDRDAVKKNKVLPSQSSSATADHGARIYPFKNTPLRIHGDASVVLHDRGKFVFICF